MKPNKLTEFWQARQPREKIMLASAVVILAFIIFYFFIWEPLNNLVTQSKDQLAQNQMLLTKIQPLTNSPGFIRLAQEEASPIPGSLVEVINQTASQTRLINVMTVTASKSNNEASVTFTQVSFDQLINWLESLWDRNSIFVSQFEVTSTKNPGMVSAKIVLNKK